MHTDFYPVQFRQEATAHPKTGHSYYKESVDRQKQYNSPSISLPHRYFFSVCVILISSSGILNHLLLLEEGFITFTEISESLSVLSLIHI